MTYATARLTVDDFDSWKSDFDGLTPGREEHGVRGHRIFRSTDDANDVVVLLEFDTEERARGWTEYLDEWAHCRSRGRPASR